MGTAKGLSTVVDNKSVKARAPRVPAAQTRAKILAAARLVFCQSGFDQVGVRELAKAAQVDPAVVIRHFGTKEALFTEVAQLAFSMDKPFDYPVEELVDNLVGYLTGDTKKEHEPDDGFSEFDFLLRSAASPTAGPILSAALHASFILPLAEKLGEPEANTRAAMMTAWLLGFATLKVALGSPDLEKDEAGSVARRIRAVFNACLELP